MEEVRRLGSDLKVNFELLEKQIKNLTLYEMSNTIAYNLDHPDYQMLAGRLRYHYLLTHIPKPYSKAVLDERFDKILDPELVKFTLRNAVVLDEIIENDAISPMRYAWVSIRTLEKGYLKRYTNRTTGVNEPLEDVRYAIMRICIHIFKKTSNAIENIRRAYEYISQGYISPASPTWFNAGTKYPQMKSCFLTRVDDNIDSIMNAFSDTALVSKEGGGNGVHISDLRHSTVRSDGESGGIKPWMDMWDKQAIAINQGGNRKGAFTFFLADWHKDSPTFTDLRLPEGDPDKRTHNLNVCIWISDLLFKRAIKNETWSLFCPAQAKGLVESYGEQFERLYTKYENNGDIPRITISAKHHVAHMLKNSIMSGEPFIMSADACNACSNQKHDCVHTGSNLCTEIVEKASEDQIAACNLISLRLSAFVKHSSVKLSTDSMQAYSQHNITNYAKAHWFDFEKFAEACRFCVRFLNLVTENNFYPVDRIKASDNLHNPIGIGTQDFDGLLKLLDLPWVDDNGNPNQEALKLKEKIWACKYYNTLEESCNMAIERGMPYSSFRGSPLSHGEFQFDLWQKRWHDLENFIKENNIPGAERIINLKKRPIINPNEWGAYDSTWDKLRAKIIKHGVVNSLLNCDMPTATQANIQGSTECFEPLSYILFSKNLLAGDCCVYNKYFVQDLEELGLWSVKIKEFLMKNSGRCNGLVEMLSAEHDLSSNIVDRLKYIELKYKTINEIPMMTQSDFATVACQYVCQSTSFNIHMVSPSPNDLFNLWVYRWLSGHKTISYYLRTESAVDALKYTIRDTKAKSRKREIVCIGCE